MASLLGLPSIGALSHDWLAELKKMKTGALESVQSRNNQLTTTATFGRTITCAVPTSDYETDTIEARE